LQVQDIVVGQKPVGEVVKTNEVLSLLMDDDELAESIARRERAEKEALNAPAPVAKTKGKGKAKAAARPATASISAFGASKDADEDDFFGGSKPAAAQDDDDDDAPPAGA
jgi:DNA helicase INO80